jgi:hypothetical protein
MKTQRIRIAVAINEHGDWNCSKIDGSGQKADEAAALWAREYLDTADHLRENVVFVEADVPVPESTPIMASVLGTETKGSAP